ncbi:MAG: U32 family peptidase [Clostridia bacterium]|nr:U32 family peptidase [Clostridia bacterium]
MNELKSVPLPELLSPAGNFEKMESAFRFGADAVYLAGTRFGMRAAADNFSFEEQKTAVDYAHNLGKKVYVTLNVMPRQYEIKNLELYLSELKEVKPDAVIVADLGVFTLCKKHIPEIPIHISTQAATVNAESCKAWYHMGASRVVLARELSLAEIISIRENIPAQLEIEAFVHGSMCVSFSGRCMLSEFYTGRDANRGECTQPCRWQYQFHEEKRPDEVLSCEIHPEGSYIFGSKDLCMIEHMKELAQAGINSFKIEGRMKSAYYTALVTNAYRIAMDHMNEHFDFVPLLRELDSVSHREYCTGYYYDHVLKNSQLATDNGYIGEKSYLCTVLEYDSATGLAKCKQKNKFSLGESCEFITPGKCGQAFEFQAMYDEKMNPIQSCPHPQQIFYIQTKTKLRTGDLIRK